MSKPWFRMYTEILEDPKIQRLDGKLVKHWLNCLCLTGRNDGTLPEAGTMAWILRSTVTEVGSLTQALITAGLLDVQPDNSLVPHGWKERQYLSDGTSTARARKSRKRKVKQPCNNDATLHATINATDMQRCASVSVSVSASENLKPENQNPVRTREVSMVAFADWWVRWCTLTGRKLRESMACQAWISVVATAELAAAAMDCVERYGKSDEVQRGIVANPDRWIYDQARDKFAAEWQPRPIQPGQEKRNGVLELSKVFTAMRKAQNDK